MGTLNFRERLYSLEIMPLHGNELIYLSMPLSEINSLLWDYFSIAGQQQNSGFGMFYTIKLENTIQLTLDILTQKVYRIEFLALYKGKFGHIGIGNSIKELCNQVQNVKFDEQFVLVGDYPYDYILEIDNSGNTIYNLNDILDNTITKIIVENKELLKVK